MDGELREGMLLGMGNPLLDLSAVVDEGLLAKYDLKPNNAILAEAKHMKLYEELVDNYNVEYIAGGATMNALRVAQWVLNKPKVSSFFGCVGLDKFGQILTDKARQDGVNVQFQYNDKKPTGTCAVLITNNGTERSLCANLAAANCFTPDHIRLPENKKVIENADFYYISGFFLTVSVESILEVAQSALQRNKIFMMNLSAPFLCKFFKEQQMRAFPYVDILFGNETEAIEFASEQGFEDVEDLHNIALKMSKLPKQNPARPRVVILTQGTKPVILCKDGDITEFPVIQLSPKEVVDTNGAGDAFVGGFLAQYVKGAPWEKCIECGIWTATEIVKRSGCTFEGPALFDK